MIIKRTEIAPDISISQLGFGTTMMGGLGKDASMPTKEGAEILKHGLDMGVNYLDSALLYGGGEGLEALGVALGETPPKDLVISFKVGRVLANGEFKHEANGKDVHIDNTYASKPKFFYNYSEEGVQAAFEQSIQHLNAGRKREGMKELKPEDLNIVVYVHDPDVRVHGAEKQPVIMEQVMNEAFPTLYKMQQQGKIKAYGIGTNEVATCIKSLNDPHIKLLMLAGRGTLLCNDAPTAPQQIKDDSRGLALLASKIKKHSNNVKLVIAAIGNSSLGYGGNTYNYVPASSGVISYRDRMRNAVTQYQNGSTGISMTDLVVRYPIDFFGDALAAVVSGPGSQTEIDSVVQSYGKQVSPELWQHLRGGGLLNPKLQLGGEVSQGRSRGTS